MYKIIYELNNDQRFVEIEESGGICDDATILWDERVDGTLPESYMQYIGCLVKDGDELVPDLEKKEYLDGVKELEAQAEANRIADINACNEALVNVASATTLEDLKLCIKAIAYTLGAI